MNCRRCKDRKTLAVDVKTADGWRVVMRPCPDCGKACCAGAPRREEVKP